MKTKKCPSCGAPLSGSVCSYCGQQFEEPSALSPAPGRTAGTKIQVIRPKRSILDKILIFLGGVWVLIVLAVAVDLRYYHPAEIAAVLLAASPGIVLLLIGFRKKKTVIVEEASEENGEGQ